MRKSRNLRGKQVRIFKPVKLIVSDIFPTSAVVLERGAGAVCANMLTNTIEKAIEKHKPGSKLTKVVAPGMILVGMIGEATIQNRFAVAPFQGISSEGIRRTLIDNLPVSIKTKLNLNGLDGLGAGNTTLTEADVLEAINELDKEQARKSGTYGVGRNGDSTFDGTLNGPEQE